MTFAHYDFTRGSSIHEHFHAEEEVYEVIEGELEVTIDGLAQIARVGLVAIVRSNVHHSVKALTDERVIIVDHPASSVRRDAGRGPPIDPLTPPCFGIPLGRIGVVEKWLRSPSVFHAGPLKSLSRLPRCGLPTTASRHCPMSSPRRSPSSR